MKPRWMALALLVGGGVVAADYPSGLPVGADEAQVLLLQALADGSPPVWLLRTQWSALGEDARVALVRGGLAWTRGYVESAAFAEAYASQRALARPEPPAQAAAVDEQMAAQRREQEAQIATMRESLSAYDPELRQEMEKAIAESEQAMKAMYEDPELQGYQRQALEQQSRQAQAEYRQALADWEREWPQDPRQLLARRLQEFVRVCGSVDFAAELQDAPYGRKKVFADPALEAQGWQWKTCFRAGRAPVEAALAFSRDWLGALSR